MSRAVRRPVPKLSAIGRAIAFAFALALGIAATPAFAATKPADHPRVPRAAEHTEFVVEVNRKGQVSRVRSGKPSGDGAFNTMTLGNALQAYIRTSDGKAIAGIYRLSYDYRPDSKRVRRSVAFIRAGGVDANEPGAVDRMAEIARRGHASPAPSPSANTLPDFGSITGVNR